MEACTPTKPVTVITGATGGIGTALALALKDHDLILTGRNPEKLEALCSGIPNSKPLILELQKPESFAAALEGFLRIDNLIHNAGVGELGTVEDTARGLARDFRHEFARLC
jgi:NADP-dependent 3-hydroxy acid dehydrogenase YdfG